MRVVGYIVGGLIAFFSLPVAIAGLVIIGWLGDGSGLDVPIKGLDAPPEVVAIVGPEFSLKASDLPSEVRDSSVTFTITPQAGSAPLFIGLAKSSDLKRYLRDVTIARPEVKDASGGTATSSGDGGGAPDPQSVIAGEGADVELIVEPGRRKRVAPPGTKRFWIRQADSATGEITVSVADLDGRDVRVVALRADGRPGIAADAELHFRIPFLRTLGWYILLGGLIPFGLGVGLIVILVVTGRRGGSGAPPATSAMPAADVPTAQAASGTHGADATTARPAVDTEPSPPQADDTPPA